MTDEEIGLVSPVRKGLSDADIGLGPIQKMKPTSHDYWSDIGAAIEPLTPHGLLNQPQRLINLIRQGFGKQPYGELDTTKSIIPSDLFQSHPTPQELATDPTYAWMKDKTPEEIGAYGEKLAQAELGQRTLSMAPGTGFFGGPEVPPWMLQPNFGRVIPAQGNRPQPTGLFPNEPLFQGLQRDLAIGGGVAQPLNELVSGIASTEGAAMLPAFMAGGPLAQAARLALASQAALHAPESIAQRAQVAGANPNAQNITSMLVGSPLDIAVPLGMAGFQEPVVRQRGLAEHITQGSPEFPFTMPNRPGIPMEDKPQFRETPPLIGQRPVRYENPVLSPYEAKPIDPLQIEQGTAFKGEPKQGGQISFQGQGIPSAMQSRVIPKGEQSEQAALMQGSFVPSTKEGRLQSGIDVEELRKRLVPAINLGGRIITGRQGDTHADVLEANGMSGQAIAHTDPARGFYDPETKKFMSRVEAQKATGIEGSAQAGGLDSMDLPGAAQMGAMRKAGFSDSEIGMVMGGEKLRSGIWNPVERDLSYQDLEKEFTRVTFPKKHEVQRKGTGDQRGKVETGPMLRLENEIKEARSIDPRLRTLLDRNNWGAQKASHFIFNIENAKKQGGQPIMLDTEKAIFERIETQHPEISLMNKEVVSGDLRDNAIPSFAIQRLIVEGIEPSEALRVINNKDYASWQDLVEAGDISKGLQNWIDHRLFDKEIKHKEKYGLYSGIPIFDENLWGSKEKVEKEQKEAVKLGIGKQPITSLPLDSNPNKAVEQTTKLQSGILPALTGYGVDRPLKEVIDAFTAKQAGWSAPRHVAANEQLGNALVRVAASDIAAVMESKASSPAIAARNKADAYRNLYDAYINAGLGQRFVRGAPAPQMGGKPMELVHINKKPLWVRSDLEPEFSQALASDSRVRKAGAALLMDLATELQVIGLTDFTFHSANMFGSIVYDLGAKTTEGDLVRGTVPGARYIDGLMRIGHEMQRVIQDDPAVRRELADIAKIGALRAEEQGQSLLARTPGIGKYLDTGRLIQLFDKAGRLARNKMFDNLVDRKLLKDTELDRREFINKMGQYNARLMSKFQDFQRQYMSQFVVAGRTFNRNAFQRVMMSNQARALNPSAYAKMKALNAISLFSALLVTPVIINMWTTGKPFGRPGTNIGSIDTGKDDENGRIRQIDLLQTILLRRGLRNIGVESLQKDVRAGKDFKTTATDMGRDIANGLIHPWAGPPIRMGWTAITGKSVGFGGFPLSKDTDSLTDNFLAGLAQVNPMVASAYEKSTKGDKAEGYFERTLAAGGLKKGPFPTHEEDLEKETGKKVSSMSLAERVQAEKTHKEKAEKLPPEVKAKAAEKSIANITKRGEELSKQMTKADRQWMESRGLNVPGFDNKIHAGKTLVYLTKDEMERLSKYTLDAYNEAMPEVRNKYPQLPSQQQDIYFNTRMSAARGKARARLINELNSKNESNQKKKRFSVFDTE